MRLFDATMEERFNRWACYLAAAIFAGAPDGQAEGGVTVSQSISSARPQSSSSGFRLPIVAETKSILPGRPSAWGVGCRDHLAVRDTVVCIHQARLSMWLSRFLRLLRGRLYGIRRRLKAAADDLAPDFEFPSKVLISQEAAFALFHRNYFAFAEHE